MVFVGSDDKFLYALDEATGVLVWKYQTGGNVKSSSAIVNGRLYVGSEDGYLYCFGPGQGIMPQDYGSEAPDFRLYSTIAASIIAVGVMGVYLYVRLKSRRKKGSFFVMKCQQTCWDSVGSFSAMKKGYQL
jgi:outer membrane protein assembly factor BamB